MSFDVFDGDPKDRKRRFLRGLNRMLGHSDLEDKDIPLGEAAKVSASELRNQLANKYCLEFTEEEITQLMNGDMTTGEFTEMYVPVVYKDRGNVDMNLLADQATIVQNGELVVKIEIIDSAPKYGLNGREWCDVAEGPCSCGAWH
jgi:hypothetical protein